MIIINSIKLIKGDCLEQMDKLIEQNIKVDMILTDIPYGTTACRWDEIIPFDKMWERINLIKKDKHTPILLFGSEPFSSKLRLSNIKNYKYDWKWNKTKPVGFANAKKMPLKNIEDICTFYEKLPTYNPQGLIKCDRVINNSTKQFKQNNITAINGGAFKTKIYKQEYTNYPRQLLKFNIQQGLHPTQKPTDLLSYLIKTYSNSNDVILDFTMGVASTGISCIETNRNFIGIEKDDKYFDIGVNRINTYLKDNNLEDNWNVEIE